ncbi:MAG: hypothetical protein LHW56_01195 [Candidatus Cloacimonetes bacterium]|nr:hypothetical protein [Candidatus Cloacimonadota bacterium]MDY0171501.1 hypothetical protein [Candidatus Cloacimonadaceae bacterium]
MDFNSRRQRFPLPLEVQSAAKATVKAMIFEVQSAAKATVKAMIFEVQNAAKINVYI